MICISRNRKQKAEPDLVDSLLLPPPTLLPPTEPAGSHASRGSDGSKRSAPPQGPDEPSGPRTRDNCEKKRHGPVTRSQTRPPPPRKRLRRNSEQQGASHQADEEEEKEDGKELEDQTNEEEVEEGDEANSPVNDDSRRARRERALAAAAAATAAASTVKPSKGRAASVYHPQNAHVHATLQHLSPGPVSCVAFSPDGTRVATACGTAVCVWDVTSDPADRAQPSRVLLGHSGAVTCAAFSPCGSLIASGSDDSSVRIWNAATGECSNVLQEDDSGAVNCVAFSPDGALLASGCNDSSICIWRVVAADRGCFLLNGHGSRVSCVAFSPNGSQLASCSDLDVDAHVIIWDMRTRQILSCWDHDGASRVAFSPCGLVVTSSHTSLTIWDEAESVELKHSRQPGQVKLKPLVKSFAFSPDGSAIVSGCNDSTVRVWDVASRKFIGKLGGRKKHSDSVHCVAFSRDGTMLASASSDSTVILWAFLAGRSPGPSAAAPRTVPRPIVDLASGSGGDQEPLQGDGDGQGQPFRLLRAGTSFDALETLKSQDALQKAIDQNLQDAQFYSGTVLEVELEKIRRRVRLSDPATHPFYASIAPVSLLTDVRDKLNNCRSGLSSLRSEPLPQWLDTRAANLGIATGRLREGGADRVLFLLHTDHTWTGGKEGCSLMHFAVLSVDLVRDDPAFGATSANLVIYDSKRKDYATGLSLDDEAIKLQWTPQIAVVKKLLGHVAVEDDSISVARVHPQLRTNNDCGVHAIM